jgi:hypothetical protein
VILVIFRLIVIGSVFTFFIRAREGFPIMLVVLQIATATRKSHPVGVVERFIAAPHVQPTIGWQIAF